MPAGLGQMLGSTGPPQAVLKWQLRDHAISLTWGSPSREVESLHVVQRAVQVHASWSPLHTHGHQKGHVSCSKHLPCQSLQAMRVIQRAVQVHASRFPLHTQ